MVSQVVKEYNQNSIYVQIFKHNVHKLNYQDEPFTLAMNVLYEDNKKWLENNLNNIFYSENTKNKILHLYSNSTLKFLRLIRFVNYCKNFYRPVMSEKDLELNTININKKENIKINHYGLYYFTAQDLYRICITSLLNHSNDFYIEPNPIKNPYNNIPFEKFELYKIYFHLKFNSQFDLTLLYKYFKCHFDLDEFAFHNEAYLKDLYIERYVKFEIETTLYKKIILMLNDYNRKVYVPFKIEWDDTKISKNKIVAIFRPYLKYYLKSVYSQFTYDKNRYKKYYIGKLKEFSIDNHQFGREIKVKETVTNSNPFLKPASKYIKKTIDTIQKGFSTKFKIKENGHKEFTGLSASQREINFYNRSRLFSSTDSSNNVHIFIGENSFLRHIFEVDPPLRNNNIFGNIDQDNSDENENVPYIYPEQDSDGEVETERLRQSMNEFPEDEEENDSDDEDEEEELNSDDSDDSDDEDEEDSDGEEEANEENNETNEIVSNFTATFEDSPTSMQSSSNITSDNSIDSSGNSHNTLVNAFYNCLTPDNLNNLQRQTGLSTDDLQIISQDDLSMTIKFLADTFSFTDPSFCNLLMPEIVKMQPQNIEPVNDSNQKNTSLINSNEEFHLDNIFEEKYPYEEFNIFTNYRLHIHSIERLLEDDN